MLRDEIQRDLRDEIERDLRGPDGQPQWLVFSSLTMPCAPASVEESVAIDADGNEVRLRHSVVVRTEHFLAAGLAAGAPDPDAPAPTGPRFPRSGDQVRFRWTWYRVINATFDAMQAQLRLDLADNGSNQ